MQHRPFTALGILAVTALGLTGCASAGAEAEDDTITIVAMEGWDDVVASSNLWRTVLEEQGYDVEVVYSEVATAFLGLTEGDYDLFFGSWLPVTHAAYYEQYGEDLEDLGSWNQEARNTIAVNADAPIDSLDELADNADLFGDRIVGIEPGAGLTSLTEKSAIPEYGLEDLDFRTSSTPAMLTELERALAAGENIAVTLWEPHWAYSSYDIKNLDDPKGAMGEAENIMNFARPGFTKAHPEAAAWLEEFEMDLETISSLQAALFLDYDGTEYADPTAEWVEANREWVDGLTS